MNEILNTILTHRSIRSFQNKSLSDEQIHLIVKSAQAASSSSFVQAYTIIGIKNPEKKAKLAKLAGNQAYVLHNGHFFIFCLDLHRFELAVELENLQVDQLLKVIESTEMFMVGVIDTALAAQNAALAAESMDLGICYIGGIRNCLIEVSRLLKTPNRVVPLFGMCVGYPDRITNQKLRLPLEHIYHEEEYIQDDATLKHHLEQYNKVISDYYRKRTNGKRTEGWTKGIVHKLNNAQRLYIKDYLKKRNLPLN